MRCVRCNSKKAYKDGISGIGVQCKCPDCGLEWLDVRRKPAEVSDSEADPLAEAEARNKANKERVERERAMANESVLRSYRIKTGDDHD